MFRRCLEIDFTVLVDMDDTIEELLPAWLNYLNNKHGTRVAPEDVTGWDMKVFFPTVSHEDIYSPLFEAEFWDTVKPKPGASEALEHIIKDGFHLYIVTTSHYRALEVKMERVLFKYFPFLTWENVIIIGNKQLIKGDVLVDDGVHNLEGGSYTGILMDAPHNRTYNTQENGIIRVHNWVEAYAAISLLADRKKRLSRKG